MHHSVTSSWHYAQKILPITITTPGRGASLRSLGARVCEEVAHMVDADLIVLLLRRGGQLGVRSMHAAGVVASRTTRARPPGVAPGR